MSAALSPADYTVVVLGASANPARYSYLCLSRLAEAGYRVIGVHPALDSIKSVPVVNSLSLIAGPVHTITVYLSPLHAEPLLEVIVNCKPERVIFNPGAESAMLMDALTKKGIRVLNACTLVLISTGRFLTA